MMSLGSQRAKCKLCCGKNESQSQGAITALAPRGRRNGFVRPMCIRLVHKAKGTQLDPFVGDLQRIWGFVFGAAFQSLGSHNARKLFPQDVAPLKQIGAEHCQ